MFAKTVVAMLAAVSSLLACAGVQAHNLPYAVCRIASADDGAVTLTLSTHVPAFILGAPIAHLSPADRARFGAMSDEAIRDRIARAKDAMRREFYIAIDGAPVEAPSLNFPAIAQLREDASVPPEEARPSAPITMRIDVAGAQSIEIAAPYALGDVLAVVDVNGAEQVYRFNAGEVSPPMALQGTGRGPSVFTTFVHQGFVHILPRGLDHILFVISLAIVSTRLPLLLFQTAAFTMAHTLTLGLAIFGVVPAPPGVVEPMIALSIAAMAIDNLRQRSVSPWRSVAVGVFGLLHGLGFAGVLKDVGLPAGREALALFGFNLGVEFGQLAVIALTFLVVGWFMRKRWYFEAAVAPVSVAIAAVGMVWAVERIGAFHGIQ